MMALAAAIVAGAGFTLMALLEIRSQRKKKDKETTLVDHKSN